MDRKELEALEKKCIQDEAPQCVAACPIHVDVRAFIGFVRRESWDEAWGVLRRTMPFPGLLGRICDAPCQARCKRGEAGDPIRIGALESACVSRPPPALKLPPIAPRGKRIAVLGSGLSGLTAAWDLLKKGYEVTILEGGPALGGELRELAPSILPPRVIERETAVLKRLGVHVQLNAPAISREVLERRRDEFEAVYIDLDAVGPGEWGLRKRPDGGLDIDEKNRAVSMDGVFAGGASERSAASPVWRAAEGRWAATSIDRHVQQVSMTAGREKEGPHPTRLYVNIENARRLPAVPASAPHGGYLDSEAVEEARRCLRCECLECVKVCAFLEHFKAHPKKYAREIYNNESIVMGARQANELINSCSLCGLCERVCPEGFAMGSLCLEARKGMVNRDKMPPSAHEFALLDMAFSQGPRFSMARHEPGFSSSALLFFPGCQLCASSPGKVFRTYRHLRRRIPGGVGLMLGCCAAPAWWAGRVEMFRESLAWLKQTWTDMGRPRVAAACGACLQLFREHLPDMPVESLWETFARIGPPDGASGPSGEAALAIHDPCTTRDDPDTRGAIRALLRRIGVEIEELSLSGEYTECCGFGGLAQNANPGVAKKTVLGRAALSRSDYVTYCGMCRDNLASTGKRIVHMLDLFFPDPAIPDPAAETPPGWSLRRENRERLKQRLQTEIWHERTAEQEAHRAIEPIIPPEVGKRLDRRRILVEDLQKVILHAERTGEKFENIETGRFKASHKPFKATFWVEYEPVEKGYVIHNAYCHRMEVSRP